MWRMAVGGWRVPRHHALMTRLSFAPHQQHKASDRQQRVKAFERLFAEAGKGFATPVVCKDTGEIHT